MKRLNIAISLLLILSFLMSAMPMAADAGEITTEPIVEPPLISEEATVTEPTTEAAPTILHEDESLRGQYEKHFLMSDGTYQAVVYNEPVHYETATGWAEVDNTLSLQTAADGTSRYATADGLAEVSFSRSFDDQLVTVRQGDYSLAWGVQAVSGNTMPTISTVQAELSPVNLNAFTAEEQKTLAVKSSSTIQYRNALAQGADLEYIVLPTRVKENIILNSAQNITGYVVTVQTENLTARLLENREIEFVNADNEVIFTMTSPYMYDSAGELSEEIAVELVSRGDVCYIFMTPDADWLNDESRVYPITIDPQVTTSSERTNIIDNYVLEGSGVQNRNLDRLYIGKKSGSRARAYIKFTNMPTIPTGSNISDTKMTLHITANTSTGNTVNAYIVNGGDWSSSTITWANMPSASGPVSVDISHNNLTKYSFPCNYAVQTWYSGSTTGQNKNYGIMIRYTNETIADYNAVYSADHTTASQRPSLVITYQLPGTAASLPEGASYTLSSSGMSGTITWVSNNTSVATVNSSGKVTGVKAGKATITASVGGVVQKGFVVYVTIAGGVYYIKNGNLCLGTTGGIAEDTTTSLFAKSTSGRPQLNQLWKIAYLGSGYYSIRPLYKLDMGLCSADGLQGNVEIATIGTTDTLSNVPGIHRWTIEYNSGGYLFCCTGTSYLTMQGSQPYAGASVVTKNYSASGSGFKWTLEAATGIDNQLLLMDAATGASVADKTYYIDVGATETIAQMDIVASFVCTYNLNQSVSWYSDNASVVSINSSTGAMTAHAPEGVATITAKHFHNGVEYKESFTIIISKQMSQFIDKMGDLYDVAYSYEGGNQTKAFETLFNFIRGQLEKYTNTYWPGIVGNWNTDFVEFVETNYPSLYSYFIYDFANIPGNKESYVVSDTATDGYIDVPHLAATLNRLFYTGDTYYGDLNIQDFYDGRIDDLSGWAGDCQSLIKQYYKDGNQNWTPNKVYDIFYPLIGSSAYPFPYEDILADIDACNLYTLLSSQSIAAGEDFEAALHNYYYGSSGNVATERFTTWVGTYTEDTLQSKFFDYCNDYSTILSKQWPLIGGYSIYDDQQRAFSQAFADYFWAQREKE